jgi:RNA polymerase sigma factor (sigma-70 family)
MTNQGYSEIGVERENIELLFRDASEYLERNQSVVRCIAMKFKGSGLFTGCQIDDVVQHVNERMLTDVLEKMKSQYRPLCRLQTYFSKIVRNLCLEYAEICNKRNLQERKVDFSRAQIGTQETTSAEVAFAEIFKQLEALMKLYGSRRFRIELFFKISLRLGITEDDVLRCYPTCSKTMLNKFRSSFYHTSARHITKDSELYARLIPLVNELEGTGSTADALRKCVNRKFDEIADILNVSPINAALTRETVKLLLEKYYLEFPRSTEKTI